jgi:ferredoxin
MPKLKIKDKGEFDIEAGKRLVLAIKDSGADILHRCGGHAKCTTCRVQFEAGEPDKMTQAEKEKLESQDNLGNFRLSCQITCDADMSVEPLMTMSNQGLDDPGSRPEDSITPQPQWV